MLMNCIELKKLPALSSLLAVWKITTLGSSTIKACIYCQMFDKYPDFGGDILVRCKSRHDKVQELYKPTEERKE